MDGWIAGWLVGWIDGWMNVCMRVCDREHSKHALLYRIFTFRLLRVLSMLFVVCIQFFLFLLFVFSYYSILLIQCFPSIQCLYHRLQTVQFSVSIRVMYLYLYLLDKNETRALRTRSSALYVYLSIWKYCVYVAFVVAVAPERSEI